MTTTPWLSVLPSLLTIAIAIWSKRIIPSLLVGLLEKNFKDPYAPALLPETRQ